MKILIGGVAQKRFSAPSSSESTVEIKRSSNGPVDLRSIRTVKIEEDWLCTVEFFAWLHHIELRSLSVLQSLRLEPVGFRAIHLIDAYFHRSFAKPQAD